MVIVVGFGTTLKRECFGSFFLVQYFRLYIQVDKSMDTAKYFQNGLAEHVEIWHIVRNV
jgi:hypothetical protein